jgi:hypothetical protein
VIKGFPNIGIVVGSQATLVIDTGLGTKNGQIVAEVAQRLSSRGQKLYLTTTHYHAEHAVQNKTGPYFYCADCTPRSWLGVLDQVAALKPKIVVPDHSPPGDNTLIASEKSLMADVLARTKALKDEGKSRDEVKHIVSAEIQAKYQGWTGLNRIEDAIGRAYADTNKSAP